jgi:glutamate racemase
MSVPAAVAAQRERPIGVFDSGVGGLTVLRALRARLPAEAFIYLGDTARVPYGTRSPRSITRYSLQATQLLVDRGIKCLVVACNTASAIALDVLRQHFAPLPVIGVIEPGARAGCRASRSGHIAVIGTESTIRGGAYHEAIVRLKPAARVAARACPLFVALAEEGWTDGDIVRAVARAYLVPLFPSGALDRPDTLVLGCTHFPVLAGALRAVLEPDIRIVDSAGTTADALAGLLQERSLGRNLHMAAGPTVEFLSTDERERFARVGTVFIGEPLGADQIEVVDLASSSGADAPR